MANILGTNPMQIDTAGATVLRANYTFIRALSWQGYTSAAHTIVVQDSAGNQIFSAVGNAGLSPIEMEIGGEGLQVRGFKVPTLGSGKLIVSLA